MITRIELLETIANYEAECNRRRRKMSKCGIARRLGIAPQTINNVCSGYYNIGRPYTPTPSASRCIDNSDFDLIQGLFS